MTKTRPLLLATSLIALLGCGGGEATVKSPDNPPPAPTSATDTVSSDVASVGPTTATTSSSLPTPAPAEAQAPNPPPELTDEQILQITHTANLGEIAQAKLARSKTHDARVRRLAAMMLKDHTAADDKGMAIAKQENLTPAPSATSTSIDGDVQSATGMLRAENGVAFDRGYVDTQVKEHQAVLDVIDQKLLPSAKDPDVKAFLTEVRTKVAMHLQHAQDLQNAMR
jgi:putative membrane protein